MPEERDRLQAMVDDAKGTTWDLSPNDIKAIKWALDRIDELEKSNEATLLFHSPPPWDRTKAERWKEITGTNGCTTTALCDHIRKVLGINKYGGVT